MTNQIPISNPQKDYWNQFVIINSSPSSFLQSWQWGEFQQALGNKLYRIEIEDLLKAQAIVKKLPLSRSYLEIPKGPIIEKSKIKNQKSKIWGQFISDLRKIGRKERAVLARINPPIPILPLPEGKMKRGWEGEGEWRKPEILLRQTEPEDTVLVDLSKSEDELLQNMHEKSRYNIRLAQKKGVKVRIATQDKQAFENFLDLLGETAKRDKIVSWPSERFWKFRERFMHSISPPARGGDEEGVGENRLIPKTELLVGELEDKILAAAIVMLFGDAGTYLYAASSAENRPANAPSLVLWEAIKLAKARGMRWFDMWGIAPPNAGEDHPWAGITRFKIRYVKPGITGKEIRNIGTRDLILDKTFCIIFKLAKKLRP